MAERDEASLNLRTLTKLWVFDRRLHNLGRIRLWSPISNRLLYWGTLFFGVWVLLLQFAGVPWSRFGLTVHAVPPGLATWWVIYVVDGGVRPDELVRSWVRHGFRYRLPVRPRRWTSTIRCVR